MPANLAPRLRLMLVTDDALLAGRDLAALARAAEAGGVTMLQLRLKQATARELAEAARVLLAASALPLLVNDRPDVAIAVGAAGVHLGEGDLPVALTRAIAPPGFLIGASVASAVEALRGAGADYWGVGPYHGTTTKDDAGAPIGAAGVATVCALPGAPPCVAIGGVRPADLPAIRAAGAVGVAVVSGILAAAEPAAAAQAYREAWGGD